MIICVSMEFILSKKLYFKLSTSRRCSNSTEINIFYYQQKLCIIYIYTFTHLPLAASLIGNWQIMKVYAGLFDIIFLLFFKWDTRLRFLHKYESSTALLRPTERKAVRVLLKLFVNQYWLDVDFFFLKILPSLPLLASCFVCEKKYIFLPSSLEN